MRLTLALAALIALATPASAVTNFHLPAPQAGAGQDLLLVALEDSKGKKSMHYQKMPHEHCSRFLKEYGQITKAGGAVTLTFESPPKVTGKVLSANCIRPDGTIEGDI